jgi:hypothetical protein
MLKFYAGDFNGDGFADVGAVVDYPPCHIALWTWTTASATSLGDHTTGWDSGTNAWCGGYITAVPGDYNADTKTDVGLLYRGGGQYQAQAWVAASNGTGGYTVTEGANGAIGPIGTGSVSIDTVLGASQQKYQLLNPTANTCIDDTAGNLQGQPCAATAKQYVTFERRGAEYVSIHPADPAGTCYDITWANTANGSPLAVNACHGVATQNYMLAEYYNIQYVGGSPSAPMVRFITPLSGKCVDLAYGSATPGTPVQEWDCNSGAAQQWLLKPVA